MTIWNSPTVDPAPIITEEQREALRQYASRYNGRASAVAMSHVAWLAEKIRTTVTDLLTDAQLREELAIESLVRAKAACEDTEEPAVVALEAAQAVSNLEAHIEELTKIIDEHGAPAPRAHRDRVHVSYANTDPTYPSDAAAVDEDKTGDCDA